MKTRACALLGVLLVAVGCSSGSGTPAGDPPNESAPQQTTVVQMDHDGDGELDLLTLDTSRTPYRILEAIYGGTAGADPVDVTDSLRGMELDIDLSNALADYFTSSFAVDGRTELDVAGSGGAPVKVVVFE